MAEDATLTTSGNDWGAGNQHCASDSKVIIDAIMELTHSLRTSIWTDQLVDEMPVAKFIMTIQDGLMLPGFTRLGNGLKCRVVAIIWFRGCSSP